MSPLLAGAASPDLDTMTVRPWPDPVIDALGHDPRSPYVERFWLGILGPSTTWLMRLLAAGFDASPAGFELDLAEAATVLGLGNRGGRHSPFMRAHGRCCRFDLAESRGGDVLAVRRKIPPLNRRQLLHLSPALQAAHREWQEAVLDVPGSEQLRRRSRRLALSLLELARTGRRRSASSCAGSSTLLWLGKRPHGPPIASAKPCSRLMGTAPQETVPPEHPRPGRPGGRPHDRPPGLFSKRGLGNPSAPCYS